MSSVYEGNRYPQDLPIPEGDERHRMLKMHGEIPLINGYSLSRVHGYSVPSRPRQTTPRRSQLSKGFYYQVNRTESVEDDRFTSIAFASHPKRSENKPLTAMWKRATGLQVFLDAANAYYEKVAQIEEGSSPIDIKVETLTEYAFGDSIAGGRVLYPVDENDIRKIALLSDETLEQIDDVRLEGPGGKFVDGNGWYLRVSPELPRDPSKREVVVGTLQEVFRATTHNEALIPVFDAALDVVLSDPFQRITPQSHSEASL